MAELPPSHERGAALLTVLLLVAVMAMIAATALERLSLATRLAANGAATDQGRAYLDAAEATARLRIADLVGRNPGKLTLQGGWLGAPQVIPVPGGTAAVRVTDGGNCFNLNSLVAGEQADSLAVRPVGAAQFTALMEALGIDPRAARAIAAAAADWIDSDSIPSPGGAEDETYLQLDRPYRTANGLMAHASELRAVRGVTPEIYARLAPWVCALPTSDLSPINVNTLLPTQAPLLAMMLPGRVGSEQAREYLARRPAGGYGNVDAFWALPARAGISPDAEVAQQVQVKTDYFRIAISVNLGDTQVDETALLDMSEPPARVVYRQWTDPAEGL